MRQRKENKKIKVVRVMPYVDGKTKHKNGKDKIQWIVTKNFK